MTDYEALPTMISTTPFDAEIFQNSCTSPIVLDIGCGYGRIMRVLLDLGISVYGVDVSAVQIKRSAPDCRGRAVCASATSLPFRDRIFGGIIALGVIDSLLTAKELRQFFCECSRVLSSRAPLWINFYTTIITEVPRARYGLIDPSNPAVIRTKSGLTVRHWTENEIIEVMGSDYVAEETIRYDFLSMNHRKKVPGIQMRLRRAE